MQKPRSKFEVFNNVKIDRLQLEVQNWLNTANIKMMNESDMPVIRIISAQTLINPEDSSLCHHIVYWEEAT